MKTILFAALLTSLATVATADVMVMDNDKTIAVDCAKDPKVSLMGNHLTVTLTGVCASLSVSGNEITVTGSAKAVSVPGNKNTLTIAQTDAISVAGNENTVTYGKGLTKGKGKPRVSSVGTKNKITQQK